MNKSRNNSNGITLIELIAVIGIIGIIYLVSVPLYRGFQTTMVLKSTAQGVKNYIEQAKSNALNYNRTFTVELNPTDQKLTTKDSLEDLQTSDPTAYAQEISEGGAIQKIKDFIAPKQVAITMTEGANNKIAVSSSNTMNACSIWIQKTGTTRYYTITTNSTGGVRIYAYKKN